MIQQVTIFSFLISVLLLSFNVYAIEKQKIEEYKIIRDDLKTNHFAETENYYFLYGKSQAGDYDDDDEAVLFAEDDAYDRLRIRAFNLICWPDYISIEVRVKIFHEYLNLNPLMTHIEGFTILKKKINREKDFEIFFSINKKKDTITFPSTRDIGFLDVCR